MRNKLGRRWMKAAACICCGLLVSVAGAQSFDLGSWNVLNLRYQHHPRWVFFGEAQLRSLLFYQHFHYYEYKGGVEYRAHPSMRIALGAGNYDTYAEGGNFVQPKNNDEFRLWPQLVLAQSVGAFQIEQRYRYEMRFTSAAGFRNRYRYRAGLAYPVARIGVARRPVKVLINNELFFTNREPYFERNRFIVGSLWPLSANADLQIGYIHQFDYRINDETGRDFLTIGLFLTLGGQVDRPDVSPDTAVRFEPARGVGR